MGYRGFVVWTLLDTILYPTPCYVAIYWTKPMHGGEDDLDTPCYTKRHGRYE